jgi:hypothetical protein
MDVCALSGRVLKNNPARELHRQGELFRHRKTAKNVVILYEILKGCPGVYTQWPHVQRGGEIARHHLWDTKTEVYSSVRGSKTAQNLRDSGQSTSIGKIPVKLFADDNCGIEGSARHHHWPHCTSLKACMQ